MNLSVYSESDGVNARLKALGLTAEVLQHAAQRWYLTKISYTPNHPAFAIGIPAWMEAVVALREQLLPIGWRRSDENNHARVVHPDGSIAIGVMTGDGGTGVPEAKVSNKVPKGIRTVGAISTNQYQFEMPQLELPVPDMLPQICNDRRPLTWILLLHHATNEVRCELSLPAKISDGGHITQWQERIILPSVSLDQAEIKIAIPEGPDLDIDVKRKA